MDLKQDVRTQLFGSEQGLVVSSFEYGNGYSHCIKYNEFLDWLNKHQFLQEEFALQS